MTASSRKYLFENRILSNCNQELPEGCQIGSKSGRTPIPAEESRISAVLPVFSETDSLRQITLWLQEQLRERLLEIIIILSPRSSPESTAVCSDLARNNPKVRVDIQRDNPGLGNAVRQGLALTRGNIVLMMDSDGEMEIETVPRMLEQMLRDNNDMVVASRWIKGGGFQGYSRVKRVLNWAFQQTFRILFWTRLHDLTYGFKLIRGDLARAIVWEGALHEIACETTLKPIRLGGDVSEVPSRWTARTQGKTKNSFLRNFRYVRMALRILCRGAAIRSARPIPQSEPLKVP
jgi:dolichol-phosphate mannosyltransferase